MFDALHVFSSSSRKKSDEVIKGLTWSVHSPPGRNPLLSVQALHDFNLLGQSVLGGGWTQAAAGHRTEDRERESVWACECVSVCFYVSIMEPSGSQHRRNVSVKGMSAHLVRPRAVQTDMIAQLLGRVAQQRDR